MSGPSDGDYGKFVDISSEISGSKRYRKPPERDTGTVEISDGADVGDPGAVGGEKIVRIGDSPVKKNPDVSNSFRTSSYRRGGARFGSCSSRRDGSAGDPAENRTCPGPYVTGISIFDWGGNYSFYEKFLRDAEKYRNVEGRESRHVPFFSYIPQYSQMNSAQLNFYFWLRTCVKNGTYPMADISYILLLIYELINLSRNSDNKTDAELLGRIWSSYRTVYPILDKYMSEWMADYCLTTDVALPDSVRPFLPKIVERSTIKEFYLESALSAADSDGSKALSDCLIAAYSDYDVSRSRCLRDDPSLAAAAKELFRDLTDKMRKAKKGVFSPSRSRSVTVHRDAYSGSLCSCSVKKRLTLKLDSPFRSPEARRNVTELLRFAENAVRKRNGIRSRLTVTGLDPDVMNIAETAGEVFCRPPEEEYLSKYDAPDAGISIDDAIRVESSSWENTEILTETGETEEEDGQTVCDSEPEGAVTSDSADFSPGTDTVEDIRDGDDGITDIDGASPLEALQKIDTRLLDALRASAGSYSDGAETSFEDRCRELRLFPDSAAASINEVFSDLTGDVILEPGAEGYVIIEDYADDLLAMFREKE